MTIDNMQLQSTNESLKDPPMFVHPGGGGKGIRPNQHNQQQQQQQAQQHHHHQSHHQTHHQAPHQQHQQQQQAQLQAGSFSQTAPQTSGNSHPHPHQQQSAAPPPHQQAYQHQHNVSLAYFPYQVGQIHPHATTSAQHHPGQNASGSVGGSQLAPSPPTHTSGNGSQGASLGAGGATGNAGGAGVSNTSANASSNANSGGGGRQGASNTIAHYPQGGAIIQATLPNNNSYIAQYHILQQQNTVMAQYNAAVAAATQHVNQSGAQTGGLYPTPAQAPNSATHQQAAALHAYNYTTVTASAPTAMHHQPQMRNIVTTGPRPQMYYFPQRGSLITNAHQTTATASGSSHVGSQLHSTGSRGAATGATSYVQPPYCAPPLQMGGAIASTPQPQALLSAAALGPQQLQTAYAHLTGATSGSTSSTSINIAGSGAVVGASVSSGAEHTGGTKPRRHAIPIINPLTMEKVTFEPTSKSTTSAAVEIKAPDADSKPAKTTTVTLTAPPPATASSTTTTSTTNYTLTKDNNDKSITASVECVAETPGSTPEATGVKDKIDQQMQTDAFVKAADGEAGKQTQLPEAGTAVEAVAAATLQLSLEDKNDDTDADTPELDHDDYVIVTDDAQTAPQNLNENQVQLESDDTDQTTETDVKSMSQMEDDRQIQTAAIVADNNEDVKQKIAAAEIKATTKQQSQDQIPNANNSAAVVSATTKDLNDAEDSSITIQKQKQAQVQIDDDNKLPAANKEINQTTKTSKDQTKSTTPTSTKMGANTTTTAPTLSNVNNKKTISSETTIQKSSNQTDIRAAEAAAAAAAAAAQAANDDGFISVSNRKNRGKNAKQQQLQQQQQQQQRTKDNQKKSQQQQYQQQHQRSNSTTSNTSTHNKSHNNNNNNRSVPAAQPAQVAAAPAPTAATTHAHLTDIHNANSSSISSSVNNNKQQRQQQQQQHTASSNNNNVHVEVAKTAVETKDVENNGKHIKTQEIVDQFLQQPAVVTPTNVANNKVVEEEQIDFLNSSSSACEDDEVKQTPTPPPAITQPQLKQPAVAAAQLKQEQPASPTQDADAITTNIETDDAALKDVQFGDFKENEKIIEGNAAVPADAVASNIASQINKTPDMVDASNNQTHARPAVATLPSKPNKALHAVTPTIQKHQAKLDKQNLRYTLDELKLLAKNENSQMAPIVPCQKGGCIAQLFVSRPNNMHHMQQQYQPMNYNESIEMTTGKNRSGRVSQRKGNDHRTITSSCGNIAGVAGGPPGAGGSMVGMTGGSVSVSGTSFGRSQRVIHVNLSLNEEIKLAEAENAWQPEALRSRQGSASSQNESMASVLKRVRGVLNKLTPENFGVLLNTMKAINLDNTEKMQEVMLLIFEKTVSEPNFAPTYAKFCKTLFNEIKPESKQQFNTLLIKRIQTEFETNVNNASAKEEKLLPLVEKLEACTEPQTRTEIQAEIEDQEYQFRRRAWGTVRFIGEMYKLQSLTGDRVMLCIESLLEHGSEEKLEYMCKLLTTVGHLLESKMKGDNARMDRIFVKIHDTVHKSKSGGSNKNKVPAVKISSRVRFMMQDVMDLRSRKWDQSSTEATAAPSAAVNVGGGGGGGGASSSQHQQRRRHPDDKNQRNNYDRGGSSQRMGGGGGGGGGGGRYGDNNQGRRMDNRDGYYGKNSQKSNYQDPQINLDMNKLTFSRGDDSSKSQTLGSSSMYLWRKVAENKTAPMQSSGAFGGMTASGSYGGSTSNSNAFNNTLNRKTTNPFQVLSPKEPETESHPNSNVGRPAASHTSASSSSNEGSDDEGPMYKAKEIRGIINELIEEYTVGVASNNFDWQKLALDTWRANTLKQHMEIVHYLLMDYLHLRDVEPEDRTAIATIFAYLMRTKTFDKKSFAHSYDQFAEEIPELLVDVPNGFTYVFEFLGPLLHDGLLTFEDIWRADWKRDRTLTQRFVKALIVHFTKEFGANYVRELWHNSYKLDGGKQFTSNEEQWREFIKSNGLEFLFDPTVMPPKNLTSFDSSSPAEKKVKRLEILLKGGTTSDLAIDYINTNVNITDEFLRSLTRFLCCDYAISMAPSTSTGGSSNNSASSSSSKKSEPDAKKIPQFKDETFRKNCIPLLRRCLDGNENYDIACLDAVYDSIQQDYSDYAMVNDITISILEMLYDKEVIAKESLDKWFRQRRSQSEGGGSSDKKFRSGGVGGQQLSAQVQTYLQKIL